jgi:hypothetical protein
VVQWAHGVGGKFPDGQLYLNLRGFGPAEPIEPAAALGILLRGFGVAGEQVPVDLEARIALFRTTFAGKQVLLILDNARDTDQVRPLLPGPGSTVVVTSRSQLRGLVAREAARRIEVGVLSASESARLLGRTLSERGVPMDAAAATQLGELCGHLPLALAIASEGAERSPARALASVVDDLREYRLDALDTGADPDSGLRAVFSWSYDALDPDAARLFRLLALHPASDCGLPAAAALASTTPGHARRLVDRLINAHLVEEQQSGRFTQHDLLRAYAAEKITQIDGTAGRDDALRRLYGWYLYSAANAQALLINDPPVTEFGVPDEDVHPDTFEHQDEAKTWFERERHALLDIARAAAAHGGFDHLAAKLPAACWTYVMHRDHALAESLELEQIALAAARRSRDILAEAVASNHPRICSAAPA